MSLGHTEPITQKHTRTLQKHPREEAPGLGLQVLRLQEVLQTADFSKNWLQGRRWDGLPAIALQPTARPRPQWMGGTRPAERRLRGQGALVPRPYGFLWHVPATLCLTVPRATRSFSAHEQGKLEESES